MRACPVVRPHRTEARSAGRKLSGSWGRATGLRWRRFALGNRRAWHEQYYQCPEQGGYRERIEVPLKPELGSRVGYDVPPVQGAKDGTQPPKGQRPAERGRPTVRRVVPGGVGVDDYSRSDGPDAGQGDEYVYRPQRWLHAQQRYGRRGYEKPTGGNPLWAETVGRGTGQGGSEYGAKG